MENKQGVRGPPGTRLTVGRGRRRTRDLESLGGGRQGCGTAPSRPGWDPLPSPALPRAGFEVALWWRGAAVVSACQADLRALPARRAPAISRSRQIYY